MRFVFGGRSGLAPQVATEAQFVATRCLCGHDAAVHEHFRRGTDCGSCGSTVCRAFRPADALATIHQLRPAGDTAKAS